MTTTPDPSVRLFGTITVRVGDTTVTPPPGKPATAFAVLALASGEVVRTQTLIDALWGDRPPQSSRALVHTHVSALRRVLTAGHANAPLPATLPGGYRLDLDPDQVDVLRFLRLPVDDLTEEDLSGALTMSAAPVLSGDETEFAESWRVRVAAQRTLLQHRGWARRVASGDSATVLPDLRAAVQADPLWEGGVMLLARALDDTGRREEALSTFDRYRRALAQELGLDPSVRMAQEHQRLLRGTSPDRTPPTRPTLPPQSDAVGARGPDATREPVDPPVHAHWSRRRGPTMWMPLAVLVGATALGIWAWTTHGASPRQPMGPAALFLDPQSGVLREAVDLPVDPSAIELDAGHLWVSSTTDRAIASVDVDDRQSTRVIGLPEAPTSFATDSAAVTVGLGYSGQLVTIVNGRASPPHPLQVGNAGRLTLASHEGAAWAATVDGELFGPGLANPRALPQRIPGVPLRMAMDAERAWVLTVDRRELVAVPLTGGQPVVSALRGEPVDLAASGGSAWVATRGDDRLWRAGPPQGRVVATRQLPGPPVGVASARGVVWVAVTQPPMLVGYDPETLRQLTTVSLEQVPVDLAAAGDLLVVAVR